MSRVELLRASAMKAEAQYRQELSSVRSLHQEESRQRARLAEYRKEFWREAAGVAQSHVVTTSGQTPMCPSERMRRAHETLKSAIDMHDEALGRLHACGERLAVAQERIDLLRQMTGVVQKQRACRLENQRSDELGEIANSLVVAQPRVKGKAPLEEERRAMRPDFSNHGSCGAVAGQYVLAEQLCVAQRPEPLVPESTSLDSRISVASLCARDVEQQKMLTVECTLGTRGSVSVSLLKRDGEAIRAVISAEGAQLALSVQRDRALVLARLQGMGVRVSSLSVGEDPHSVGVEETGQRMKRRTVQEDDESRIA